MSDLLFLVHRIPYPPDKGDKIRAYHVLRHLARNFRIHLGCFADDPADLAHVGRLEEICASVHVMPLNRRVAMMRGLAALAKGGSLSEAYFHDSRMAAWVADTMAGARPSNIFVFCSAMAPYAIPYASSHRVVLDMVDVDSEKFRTYGETGKWPIALAYAREARALLALERRAARAADRSFFVSREEADIFLASAPEAKGRVGYFQNGVDLEYFDPGRSHRNPFAPDTVPVVFVGTMDYRPNVEAVEWFADKVFDRVRRDHPKAEFWIVGSNPMPKVRKLAQRAAAVHVTGRVPDVRPYLQHAACIVAPLHIARGLQNKVIEAMAMARPVVSTAAAFEGLSALAGRDVLLADTPQSFAEAVSSVLSGKADGLGARARHLVEANYDWTRNLAVLDELFDAKSETGSAREPAPRRHFGAKMIGSVS